LRCLAEDCAVLLSPPFAKIFHASLPRELRDLVYDYLWDERSVDYVDSQLSSERKIEGNVHDSQDWILRVPSFADAKFVGEPFAREAATWFFRSVTGAEVHYCNLPAFFNMNQLGHMPFCPRDIIRRLIVSVKWSVASHRTREFAYAELQENLESLLTLLVKEDFTINMYITSGMQFSCTLFRVLEIIRPYYYALVHKGHKVKVLGYRFCTLSWRKYDVIKEETSPERTCTTAEQLNYYFDGTPEDWFAMNRAEIESMREPLRKEKCLEVCPFI
jgi:hypothetical protein